MGVPPGGEEGFVAECRGEGVGGGRVAEGPADLDFRTTILLAGGSSSDISDDGDDDDEDENEGQYKLGC